MAKKKGKEFFDEMSEQSEVKAEIVRKYFWAWATVITRQIKKFGKEKIAYVDLFAGPGHYNDGTPSTPIQILESAIKDEHIAATLGAYFNDEDPDTAAALLDAIDIIPGVNLLKYKPVVRNHRVDDALASKFESWKLPTLFFLDPFGYKGLSQRLIRATLKPWGCDCIFFFNYNRINAALSNPVFTDNMNQFFGSDRAERLRVELEGRNPTDRQGLIINELKRALTDLGGKYNIEYYFKDNSGQKTSHFIILASKNVLGYDMMKNIMAGESSSEDHGVPTFGFNPLDKVRSYEKDIAPTLFDLSSNPVEELASILLIEFAGRTLTMQEIYREHHVGRRYVLKNYREALTTLEAEGKISTVPPASQRVRGGKLTFSPTVKVFFPLKGD